MVGEGDGVANSFFIEYEKGWGLWYFLLHYESVALLHTARWASSLVSDRRGASVSHDLSAGSVVPRSFCLGDFLERKRSGPLYFYTRAEPFPPFHIHCADGTFTLCMIWVGMG